MIFKSKSTNILVVVLLIIGFGIFLTWFLTATGQIEFNLGELTNDYPKRILALSNQNNKPYLAFLRKDGSEAGTYYIKQGMPNIDYQYADNRAYYFNNETSLISWVDEYNESGVLKNITPETNTLNFKISENGQKIAWSITKISQDQKSESTLYESDIDNINKKNLLTKTYTEAKCIKPYKWSHDNQSIYYTESLCSNESENFNYLNSGINKLFIDTGSIQEIAKNNYKVFDISDNDKYLAYSLSNNNDLIVKNILSSQESKIKIENEFSVDLAIFSPNSKQILISGNKKQNDKNIYQIYNSDLSGSKSKIIENFSARSWFSNNSIIANKIEPKSNGIFKINLPDKKSEKYSDYEFIGLVW